MAKRVSAKLVAERPVTPCCGVVVYSLEFVASDDGSSDPTVGAFSMCQQCGALNVITDAQTLAMRPATADELAELSDVERAGIEDARKLVRSRQQ